MRIAILKSDFNLKGSDLILLNILKQFENTGCEIQIFTSNIEKNRLNDLKIKFDCELFNFFGLFNFFQICNKSMEIFKLLRSFVISLIISIYLVLYGGNFNIVTIMQFPILIPLLRIRFKVYYYTNKFSSLGYNNDINKINDISGYSKKSLSLYYLLDLFVCYLNMICLIFANKLLFDCQYTRKRFYNVYNEYNVYNLLDERKSIVIYPIIDNTIDNAIYETIDNTDKTINKTIKNTTIDNTIDSIIIKENPINNLTNLLKSNKEFTKLKHLKGDEIKIILSLNSYQKKNNLSLAIASFKQFLEYKKGEEDFNKYILVCTGWFDFNNDENELEFLKLKALCDDEIEDILDYEGNKQYNSGNNTFKLIDKIILLKSISEADKFVLLQNSYLILYTSIDNSLSLIPFEAKYHGVFIFAHNTELNTEIIQDGISGYLMQSEDYWDWGKRIFAFFLGNEKKISKDFVYNQEEMERVIKKQTEDIMELI